MPALELHYADGTVDRRELSRTQPLTIGKQSFNDVCIADDDVGAMHCRVLWNKTAFEVTAASSGGVEVNGTSVAHMRLHTGDVIRVGSLDLIYLDEAAPDPDDDSSGFRLRDPEPEPESSRRLPASEPKPQKPTRERERDDSRRGRSERGARKPEPEVRPVEDMSLFEGPVYTESQTISTRDADDSDESVSSTPLKRNPFQSERSEKETATPSPRKPASTSSSRARPGEQEIFRSPLVLGLSIGGVVLALVSGIFWFLIGREQASRLYDRAVAELNEGQYAQSIGSFEQFLTQYSGHSLHRQAERGLDKALVQKEISGATPDWKRGLEQLHTLISHHRNETDFAEMHPTLHRYAEEIALGSARTAETARDVDLLTVSEDAQVILERFADPGAPPTAAIGRIKEARVAAVIAIGKQKLFDDAMAAVDAALAGRKPMVALSEREKLVRSYDGFSSHRRVKEALQKALDLERSLISSDEKERAAESTEVNSGIQSPALAVFQTRTRTDESSVGLVTYVLAKDCCYAVDTVTGELVWRRVIGFDAPFFPVTATASQPAVLMYDAYQNSLISCQPNSGKLIWRQKLDGRPRSSPLIHEGQIYLPTDDKSLCRIDLETGRLTERATFSQNIHGPPTLSADGNHLLVPGEMAMIYSLSMRPLAAAATTFTDHAAGSLVAPPLGMGKLLLLCENDKLDSCNLRLWNAANPKAPLVELSMKATRVRGQVRESPVLRGNQLVVPSSGEQISAFSVTDEASREGLAPVAQYRIREDEDIEKRRASGPAPKSDEKVVNLPPEPISARVPLFVTLGADRQFWAASSAFRRFEIGADSIHMDSNALAIGIATQRLQIVSDQFFVGRKAPFHDAVIFNSIDRDRMLSPWRTVLGAQLLELIPARDGGAVGISEAGHVVVLSSDRLQLGGIDVKGAVELELPNDVRRRLVSSFLHDGRMFLAAMGETTQVWIIGTAGQIELTSKLGAGEIVQTGGVLVDAGLIVPLAGRLKVVGLTANQKSIQDWIAPAGDQPALPCRFLSRLDADEVLACDSGGRLSRIQVRMTDVPHLAEAAKLQLGGPVDVPPVVRGETMVVADSNKRVQQLNWRTFDQDGVRDFPAVIRGLWSTSSHWVTWTGDGKLIALAEGRDLPVRWTIELKGLEPSGAPLEEGDQIWIACRDGTVLNIDLRTGNEIRRTKIPQALTMGVRKLAGGYYGVAADGALYRMNLNGGQ